MEDEIAIYTVTKNKQIITVLAGFHESNDMWYILNSIRQQLNCTGSLRHDGETGTAIELHGDQKDNVIHWLIQQGFITEAMAKNI